MKYFCNINDLGNFWNINNISLGDKTQIEDHSMGLYEISEDLYYLLKDTLNKNIIKIDKTKDIKIALSNEDFILEEKSALNRIKEVAFSKALEMVNGRINNRIIFDFFEFTILNNYFSSLGFIITEENREEKYLEIINTGESDKIEKLEKYLLSLDELNFSLNWYRKFKEFEKNLNQASTEEEIKTLLYNYMIQF